MLLINLLAGSDPRTAQFNSGTFTNNFPWFIRPPGTPSGRRVSSFFAARVLSLKYAPYIAVILSEAQGAEGSAFYAGWQRHSGKQICNELLQTPHQVSDRIKMGHDGDL
jgi:hypothetical protein